ncbi:hypothetical protein PT2222_550003 [Paraburkholderia tropica]
MRVTFHAIEQRDRGPACAVARERLAHSLVAAGELARTTGVFIKHAVNVADERDITALFDVERPFATALESALPKLGKEPAENRHARAAQGFELAPFAENPLAQFRLKVTARERFEDPLKGTNGAAAPGVKPERCRPVIALHTSVR